MPRSPEHASPTADPVTGEPRRGWLALVQRLEDSLGQGTLAAIVFLVGFVLYLLFADPI